ncbi:unnamed protein product [Mytilus coruscus]|uniref:Chromo domain-containing protein n=1 Tax=Mytilus coruscus TaxID=42192 RepID=A0A6J8B7T2_MYTCO|nr:unnamed protein product [Mytilus coruscus]
MLLAITFSFIISPRTQLNIRQTRWYTDFVQHLPLSVSKLGIDLNLLHSDYHSYMNQHIDKQKLIREEAVGNALKYSGPYVVHEILSPHLVKLREKDSGKLFKNPVHLDRLKVVFVCAPNPTNYFIPISVKNEQTLNEIQNGAITNSKSTSNVVSDEPSSEVKPSVNNNSRTKPLRQIRKPMRYQSELGNISETTLGDTSSSEQTDNTFYKIKRILAQRKRNDCYEYLVQYKGEPTQNAIWTVENQLNEAAKQSIIKKKNTSSYRLRRIDDVTFFSWT